MWPETSACPRLGLQDPSRQDLGLFMIISFLLNFSGQTEEQRNSFLQVSVSGLELLPHVVGEMRMYDCRLRRKGWHVSEPGKGGGRPHAVPGVR